MVAGEVSKFVGNADGLSKTVEGLVAFCAKPWKLEAIFGMWNEPCIDGPGCLGDPSALRIMIEPKSVKNELIGCLTKFVKNELMG